MALLELVVQTNYANQVCINRWNYQSSGEPASSTFSSLLSRGFGLIQETDGSFPVDSVMAAWSTLAPPEVTFVQWEARDIYSVTDFFQSPFQPATIGENTGTQALSPTTAYGFRTNRTRTDIRRATKRFVGVTEGAVDGLGVLAPGGLTLVNPVAVAMSQVLTVNDEGNTVTFSPIVVSKERYVVPESGNTAYRYYPTEAEQLENIMTGILWEPYTTTRTQTSRQYGRGV